MFFLNDKNSELRASNSPANESLIMAARFLKFTHFPMFYFWLLLIYIYDKE